MYESTFGMRWVCFQCAARFFDLNKKQSICPKCGANQAENPDRLAPQPSSRQKEKEPEIPADIDLDKSGDNGIESFEELEERMEQEGEAEDG